MEALLGTRGTTTDCPLAIIVRDGKLLTGLRHYTADKYKDISVWTLPGGRCDEGETLETTLRRELSEEVGITNFSIEKHLGSMPGAKTGDTVHLFLCKSGQNPILKEPEKFSEWRFATPDEILKDFMHKEVLLFIRETLFN
jgi:8-oxo-dGTP pyrophosphatase MutT (NUDIX family)